MKADAIKVTVQSLEELHKLTTKKINFKKPLVFPMEVWVNKSTWDKVQKNKDSR